MGFIARRMDPVESSTKDEAPSEEVSTETAAAPPPVAEPAPSRRRAFLERWGLALLALLIALVVTARTHGFFMIPYAVPVSNDEGYLGATALRMAYGRWLPYVDAVSQRGPILYWLTTAMMFALGLWSWMPMRILGLLLAFFEVGLTFTLGSLTHSPLAGGLAAMCAAYLLNYELNPWDGVGVNGEPLAVCFVLAANLALLRAPDARNRKRDLSFFLSGLLIAGAGLSKQMFLAHGLPLFLWVLLGVRRRGSTEEAPSRASRGRDLGFFAVGVVLPYLVVLAIYASQRQLGTFIYYYQRYGRDIFMAPLDRRVILDKIREEIDKYFLYFAVFATVWAGWLSRWVRELWSLPGSALTRLRAEPWPWLLALHVLLALFGACFTFRFFPHYFVQLVPFVSLLVGSLLASSTRRDSDRSLWGEQASGLVLVLGGLLVLGVSHSALRRNVQIRRESDRWYQDPARDPIVRYMTERTSPRQPVFVWGFRAETYVSAQRFPGSRYVYTVYPAGVVPWFQATHEEEERRVVPGSRAQLIEDLETWAPELVIDAGRSMNGRYMYNYPELRSYLDRRYCFMRYVDGEPVYRRRRGERCPPADY